MTLHFDKMGPVFIQDKQKERGRETDTETEREGDRKQS